MSKRIPRFMAAMMEAAGPFRVKRKRKMAVRGMATPNRAARRGNLVFAAGRTGLNSPRSFRFKVLLLKIM